MSDSSDDTTMYNSTVFRVHQHDPHRQPVRLHISTERTQHTGPARVASHLSVCVCLSAMPNYLSCSSDTASSIHLGSGRHSRPLSTSPCRHAPHSTHPSLVCR